MIPTRNPFLFAALLALTAPLPAATISFTYSGTVNGLSIEESVDSGATYTAWSSGQLAITVTSSSGFAGPIPTNFMTFCIEPLQGISGGSYTYTIDPLQDAPTMPGAMGNIKADLLRELFGRYYTTFQQTLTPATAAALQISIWEIVQESSGPFNISTGTIRYQSSAHPDVIIQANAMLASLDGTGPMLANLYALRGGTNQDLAFRSEISVPEPATFGWGCAALVLALAARRRSALGQRASCGQ